VETLNSIIITV